MASNFYSSALEALVACAKAIEDEDLQLADSLLHKIYKLAACQSNEDVKSVVVVKYFVDALVRRAYGLQTPAATNQTLHLPSPLSFHYSSDVKTAITNAVTRKKRLHLIDFYIPHQYQPYMFCLLKPADEEPQKLYSTSSARVSVVLPPFLKTLVNVQRETQYLIEEAKGIKGFELEEELEVIYANSLSEVDTLGFIRTDEDEAVIVFYNYKLQRLLAKEGGVDGELLKLRQINPDLVIILEEDADLHHSNFIQRLKDSFQYYYLAFTSYAHGFLVEDDEYCRREIDNIVGCEGNDRIVRFQKKADWNSCLRDVGFIQVWESQVYVGYRSFLSAWKVGDLEQHNLNPKSDSIPIPLTKNKVRSLPLFSQGHLLNRLAALSEIYDMIEDVSCKYELPLALTWACGHTDKIISGPYNNNVFSMEEDYCYAPRKLFSNKKYLLSRDYLVKRKYEKLLQSNKSFLCEPSFEDNPITARGIGPLAAVAICLQSHYNRFYVVEFFLPIAEREHEELALDIFSDLKKMEKKFVTVQVMGTENELQEEEEAISTIPREITNTIEGRAGHDMLETRSLNEQGCEKQTSFLSNTTDVVKDVSNSRITSTKKRKLKSSSVWLKKKLKSSVWKEFNREEEECGTKWAICKHCHGDFDGSSENGTSHLKYHLNTCKKRPPNVTDQQMTCPVGRTQSGYGDQSSFDQEISNLNLARMIIKLQLPLNMVEEESFSTFSKGLQPMFKVYTQEALSSYIIRIYEEEKLKLLEYFDKLSCRFNLSISLWESDMRKTMYCWYVVQFMDDNWECKKKILALKMFRGDFEAKIFYESLKDVIVDWKFDKKVCSLTLHSSSPSFETMYPQKLCILQAHFETMYPSSTFCISDECMSGVLAN